MLTKLPSPYGIIGSQWVNRLAVDIILYKSTTSSECLITTYFRSFIVHYNDVIMGAMASQITSLIIVYSTVYSGAYQRKNQRSTSLAFVQGIHRWPVNSPHKGSVTRKMFPFDHVIMTKDQRTHLQLPLLLQKITNNTILQQNDSGTGQNYKISSDTNSVIGMLTHQNV